MSEYCLKPSATNENIMFVQARDSNVDEVFSPTRSPKRLCLDFESRGAESSPGSPVCLLTDASKRPLQDVTLRCSSSNNSGSPSPSPPYPDSPSTPTRSSDCTAGRPEPLTPTARLKLLSSLADRLPYASGDNSMDDELSNHSSNSENTKPVSRKDKSLGLLCQAFLALYPEYASPSDNIIVSLDEAARILGVERRRVYDIVNVLESVGMVAKEAKNKYRWFGKGALLETLPKLKALSEKSNMAAQIHSVKDFEFSHSLEMSQLFVVPSNEAINRGQASLAAMPENGGFLNAFLQDAELRREKSMGIMSQRFLMLFLTAPPKTVSLDLAAKVLIGDPTVDKTQSLVYKTKIRRLYDIANILTSLNLIRKVTVTEARGRKSAFKYIGPDIGSANTDEVAQIQSQSRHSLVATTGLTFKPTGKTKVAADEPVRLSPSPNTPNSDGCTAQVLELLQRTQVDHPKRGSRLMRTQSDDFSSAAQKGRRKWKSATPFAKVSSAKPLVRHSSFHDICEVAEMERRRLYSAEEDNRVEAMVMAKASGSGVTANEEAQSTEDNGTGVTSSNEGVSSCGVEQATPDTTSETSAAKESHVITLSAEQYMKLLQSLNLPVHSKPIISIQQEKAKNVESPPSCKCTGGQQQLEQRMEPLLQTKPVPQTEAVQQTEPVPQMKPVPQVKPVVQTEPVPQTEPVSQTQPVPQTQPAQQMVQPVQQTTTAMLAPSVEVSAAILTPTFQFPNWFIEQRHEDLRTPSGGDSSVETAVSASAAVLPAAARKLTYDSAPTTPVSPAATPTNEASSSPTAGAADNATTRLPTTTTTVTPITPNYYACFFRGATPSPEVVPLVAAAPPSTSCSVSPQIPIFSPSNCMLTLSPVVLGAAPDMRAMSAIAIPAGTRFITTTTAAATPPQLPAVEKKTSTAARKLTLTK